MESLGKLQLNQQPIHISHTRLSSSFPQNHSSLSIRSLRRSTSSFKCVSIRASLSRSQDPRIPALKSLPSRLLKSTCITFTAAAALFLANLQLKPPPAIAATPWVESWRMLKAEILSHGGYLDSAKSVFEEILAKDPLCVNAYHGLLSVYYSLDSSAADLNAVEKKIEEAMEKCKIEKNHKDLRAFKLLVAQIRVMEGKYNEALNMYQELVKEEPKDFEPYLYQGILYTVMKKQDEAEKQFDKFKNLVPRNHPYREYFIDKDQNMWVTKLFAE